MKEREINSTFQFLGKYYKVVKDTNNSCRGCAFYGRQSSTCSQYKDIVGYCSNTTRRDGNAVIFIETDSNSNKRNFLLFY